MRVSNCAVLSASLLCLQGGFRAWDQAGLGVRPSVAEYSSSIFETLEDELEVAVGTASGVLRSV